MTKEEKELSNYFSMFKHPDIDKINRDIERCMGVNNISSRNYVTADPCKTWEPNVDELVKAMEPIEQRMEEDDKRLIEFGKNYIAEKVIRSTKCEYKIDTICECKDNPMNGNKCPDSFRCNLCKDNMEEKDDR